MADNVQLGTPVGTGDVCAADDVGGVKFQRVKGVWGVDGTCTDISASNPLPVVQTGALPAGTAAIGKLAANSGVDIGDVDILSIAAGDNNIGNVDIVTLPALVAGTAAIGKLAANTGVTIGAVELAAAQTLATVTTVSTVTAVTNVATIGTSVTPGTSAAHLGKAEDAAHSSGDTGVMSLAVRRDADTTLVGTDGDYAPLQVNSAGSLKVAITAGAGSGGTSIADGASFTRDTTSLTPVGGVVESSAPTVTAGDAVALSLTTGGAVRVDVASGGITGRAEDAAASGGEDGVPVLAVRRDSASSGVGADGDWANLSVDSNGLLRTTGVSTVTEDAASAGAESLVLVGGVRRDTAASSSGTDGDYSTFNLDSTGRLHVNVGNTVTVGSHAVTNAGTFVVQENGAGLTALQLIDNIVVVEDAAAAGGESGVQMLAVRRDTPASGVGADGDFAALSVNSTGALYVTGGTSSTQFAEDSVHASGDTGTLALVVRKDTAAQVAGTDGDYSALVNDASGRLHVNVGALPASTNTIEVVGDVAHDAAAAGNPVLVGAYASAAAPTNVSADADAVRLWALQSGALAQQPTYAGVLAVAGNGASGTGVQRVTIANDSTGILATVTNVATIGTSVTPGTAAANLGKAEDAAHTTADTGVFVLAVRTDTAAASSGTTGDYEALHTDSVGALWSRSTGELADDAAFTPATSRVTPVGYTADETSTDSVDEGDIGAARMTLDRKQIVTPYAHAAAGGATPFKLLDSDETEDEVKASAGKLMALHAINLTASKRYLHIYDNTAAGTTVGTTVPVLTFPIPTMGDTNGAGFTLPIPSCGIQFTTGISIATTTGFADNDTGAPGTNDVIVNGAFI